MNLDEARVFKYLTAKFGKDILFEPDGKIPPDFLVNSLYAIEARRLNQQFFQESKAEGLEQISLPIFDVLKDVLKSFDAAYQGTTYWVSMDFQRPITGFMHQLKKDMSKALSDFLKTGSAELPYELSISEKIELTIYQSQPINGRIFRLAGGVDINAGGWVIQAYIKNISYDCTAKTRG